MPSKNSKKPSELSSLLHDQEWEAAVEVAQSRPSDARQRSLRQGFFEGLKDASVLPLHESLVGDAPVFVTTAIIEAYPDAIHEKESSFGRLPLHCACRRHTSVAVVEQLLYCKSDACLIPDELGRLPLHYALSNGADPSVVQVLLQTYPESARGVDARGWTPLHVATSMGASVPVVESLLEVYPEAVIMRTKKGSSPSRCLDKHCPHREQLKEILMEYKRQFDSNYGVQSMNQQQQPLPEELEMV